MPIRRVREFLDSHNVRYEIVPHRPTYTAQEDAASSHISGKEVAKTVMVKVDGRMVMAVLPAPQMIDFDLLKGAAGAETVELAGEGEFKDIFPDCDVGAMPPFGNLYEIDVFVEEGLTKDEEIAFNAGTHSELIRLPYREYERLVAPKVGRFARDYASVK